MRPTHDLGVLLVGMVLLVTACGGSTSTPKATPAAATAAPVVTAEATTPAPEEPTEGTTDTPATGGTFDACALLTIDEVTKITGAVTTADPEGSDLADWVAGTCWWTSADMKVRFSLDYGDKASIAKSSSPSTQEQFDVTKAVYGSFGTITDLSGVGDAAFVFAGGGYAIKGDAAILLTALSGSQDQLTAILKAAVARI